MVHPPAFELAFEVGTVESLVVEETFVEALAFFFEVVPVVPLEAEHIQVGSGPMVGFIEGLVEELVVV